MFFISVNLYFIYVKSLDMKNKKEISRDLIFSQYGDFILNHGERPKNVYLFAKEGKFEEQEFYHFFSGFEQIEKEMFDHFFQNR